MSNEPAERYLLRKSSWHPPLLFLTSFLHPLLYLIVALLTSKKAPIHIGLSNKWFVKRRNRIGLGWFFGLAGLGMVSAPFIINRWENAGQLNC
jgi:hypothetical protein